MAKRKPKKRKTPSLTDPAKIDLDRLIAQVRQQAQDVNTFGKGVVRDAQSIMDQADQTRRLLPYLSPQATEDQFSVWIAAGRQLGEVRAVLSRARYSTESTGGTVNMSNTMITGAYLNAQMFVYENGFQDAWKSYMAYGARSGEREALIALLKEFGLDAPRQQGEKSALELLETAHKAFEGPITPDNPISTSLIPLRGSIDATVEMLIWMRPHQEETQSWRTKILSIGNQLKKDTLPDEVVSDLAQQCESMMNDLSHAKKGQMERDEWLVWLNRGTSYLAGLLRSLDSNKLVRRMPYP